MGDHFVLLVDRLLTESTLEAAIESGNSLKQTDPMTLQNLVDYPTCKDSGDSLSPRKMMECRICQDEDFDSHMETPCSCRGSLKYAHRKCIQRWCNEKGDTICEICNQQFKPGYTAPPPIFRLGALPMNLRGNWQISRRDLNNSRIITMVSTDSGSLDTEDDEYAASTARNIMCCRSVAIIFMVLLILRHTLPVIVSHAGSYSFPLIMLLMLRITGIILPVCIILKAVTTSILRRRNQQANLYYASSLDEEAARLTIHQPHVIAV